MLTREAACDAWALEACELSRPAYARLLVRMAGLRTAAAPALASPRTLDARVAAVLGPPVARAARGRRQASCVVAWTVLALGGARSAAARGERNVCRFTPQLAEALRQAHPEADLDGDGSCPRTRRASSRPRSAAGSAARGRRGRRTAPVSVPEGRRSSIDAEAAAELDRVLNEPLCCNCDAGDGLIPSPATRAAPPSK